MSLVNSMLRDLDKRRAGEQERLAIPDEVRPLPAEDGGVGRKRLALALALGLVVAGTIGWWWWRGTVDHPLPSAVVTPAPVQPVAPPPITVAPAAEASGAASPAPSLPIVPPPVLQSGFQAQIRQVDLATAATAAALALAQAQLPSGVERGAKESPAASPPKAAAASPKGSAPRLVAPRADGLRLDANLMLPLPAVPSALAPARQAESAPAGDGVEEDWRRAQTLLRERRHEAAEPLLRRVLAANARHEAARQALLGVLLPARRHGEAMEVLREGLQLHPGQTAWAINLARLHVERNDYPAAWQVLANGLPQAQGNGDYQAFCGTVLQRLNRFAEAQTHYRAALQIRPREARWWVGYGIALESDGKPAEAREAYQRAQALGDLPPEVAQYVDQRLR